MCACVCCDAAFERTPLTPPSQIRYAGLSNETPWGLMKCLQLGECTARARQLCSIARDCSSCAAAGKEAAAKAAWCSRGEQLACQSRLATSATHTDMRTQPPSRQPPVAAEGGLPPKRVQVSLLLPLLRLQELNLPLPPLLSSTSRDSPAHHTAHSHLPLNTSNAKHTACCAAPLTRAWRRSATWRACPCWLTAPWLWACSRCAACCCLLLPCHQTLCLLAWNRPVQAYVQYTQVQSQAHKQNSKHNTPHTGQVPGARRRPPRRTSKQIQGPLRRGRVAVRWTPRLHLLLHARLHMLLPAADPTPASAQIQPGSYSTGCD